MNSNRLTNFASRLLLVFTFGLAGVTGLSAQTSYEAPLTNAAIVKLVRAGFKEKTIISIIHNRPNTFQLDPDRLIDLKQNGVNENIILAMLAQNDNFVLSDDDWTTDSMLGRRQNQNGDNKQSNGADIFGGSQGSRSKSGGRGQTGSNEGDSTTTGSATVRILRPPTEAGGSSALKLEKTPTLTNDAVIKLVEAGFSEGTIIKRIEDSPAEFDLSAAKIGELRRRRVTDTIIAAMTAAMGDEPEPRPTAPARSKGK